MRAHLTLIAITALPLGARPLWAHDGRPLAPHDLWSAWTFDPAVVLPLGLLAILYGAGLRAFERQGSAHGRTTRQRQSTTLLVGWLALVVALVSPLHALGEALFSAHMAQHEVLVAVAAPLIVMGRPGLAMLWTFPSRVRQGVAAALHFAPIRHAWHVITLPLVAWAVHGAALWIWHLPVLYERSLTSEGAHALQHVTFLGTALLFWWSLLRGRASRGIGILALFTTAVHTGALGALIALSPRPWYPRYGETSAVWGMTALEDQQLAGILMWMPATIAYLGGALWVASGWLRPRRPRTELVRAALGCIVLLFAASGCRQKPARPDGTMVGGDAERGRLAMRQYGCISCHAVPGMVGDNPSVGPALEGFGGRVYIAGVLPNTPENLLSWILDPPAVDSLTAMPKLDVPSRDAADIAEYLYTLR